jgi:hypothetical protein
LVAIGFILALLAAGSYAGALVTAGKFVGPARPLDGKALSFSFSGVEPAGNRHLVWVVNYNRSKLPGVRRATVYVSPMGELLATVPADLDSRLTTWHRSREP